MPASIWAYGHKGDVSGVGSLQRPLYVIPKVFGYIIQDNFENKGSRLIRSTDLNSTCKIPSKMIAYLKKFKA